MNLLEVMKTNNQFWLKPVTDTKYYIGFKESVVEEIEDLSFIQLDDGNISADECFLEVESKKATFEFTLPLSFTIIEDLTENLKKNFTSNQAFAIIEIVN